ncbi:hypothetical protein [Chryseobacterium carnipullorum]|uniref:Uncharacterized protein n=1 Tax=Chryseobacterium carnipullorum TaxID=1124835 RepID=A0A376E8D4_CHRCU|nr:hypothetical protein [Chryseobacterium carnipullorum]STD03732.1 Uncharacterised protein [Chryseobacterium carnipullorum]
MSKVAMEEDTKKKTEEHPEKKERTSFGTYAFLTSTYFDFKSPIEENPNHFKGYTFSVKNADGHLLDQYRTDPLTERERNTYTTIDSLGKKIQYRQQGKNSDRTYQRADQNGYRGFCGR